ncbi:hypothetical protein [Paenibacillus ehimensis]|uniref:Uncharacterized protein n=1 Tax=Paenibacillus ehimensis TaxID=79264 RepID=A0ABT8V928_9BACL|nr:hypothetical protein [Paenibacillus ehimensis]MDO3677538.1 hypothetical protein [Paenibacillus ehimensis]MEC0211682.1 hypothetical protein [Paenibacillus ehimensis]
MKQLSKPLKLTAAVVALSTVFATGAYAGSQLEEIRAYLNNGLKLKIDGAEAVGRHAGTSDYI